MRSRKINNNITNKFGERNQNVQLIDSFSSHKCLLKPRLVFFLYLICENNFINRSNTDQITQSIWNISYFAKKKAKMESTVDVIQFKKN